MNKSIDERFYSVMFLRKNKNKQANYENFIKWINMVETIVLKKTGLYLLDVQDEMYMDCYDDGITPQSMAFTVLQGIYPDISNLHLKN